MHDIKLLIRGDTEKPIVKKNKPSKFSEKEPTSFG